MKAAGRGGRRVASRWKSFLGRYAFQDLMIFCAGATTLDFFDHRPRARVPRLPVSVMEALRTTTLPRHRFSEAAGVMLRLSSVDTITRAGDE